MGAVWLKHSDSLNLLLNGLDYADVKGVVGNTKIGIKLGTYDVMSKASFNEFLCILQDKFHISPSLTNWEQARDQFLQTIIDNTRHIDMAFSRSYCVGDLENDGCQIVKSKSGTDHITAKIDFTKTDSKLSSIVIFTGSRNFTSY